MAAPGGMTWHKRVANSPITFRVLSLLFSCWIRLVIRTSRVDMDGWDAVRQAIQNNRAVILVCWHQRLMLSPCIFPGHETRCSSLTSNKRPGRLVGHMHRRFGFTTMPMAEGLKGAANLRRILRGLAGGTSICMAPDGSSGPARVCKITPIQWARAAQVPIFTFTFSANRFWKWPTWDRLLFPKPFSHIVIEWRRWEAEVPRVMDAAEAERLRAGLEAFMNEVAAEADARAGHAAPVL